MTRTELIEKIQRESRWLLDALQAAGFRTRKIMHQASWKVNSGYTLSFNANQKNWLLAPNDRTPEYTTALNIVERTLEVKRPQLKETTGV